MPEGDTCLLDSNILLRISKSDDPRQISSFCQTAASFMTAGARCWSRITFRAYKFMTQGWQPACMSMVSDNS